MKTTNNGTIKIDTFELIQAILKAQKFQKVSEEDANLLMKHYEMNLQNDIRKRRYSSTIEVTDSVRNVMNAV